VAWLQITGDDRSERAIALGERSLRIGRSADCDIILADAGKSVSRAHAELRCEQGRYVIVDLESQNGTWVNGERVQRAEVPVDGEVRIGTHDPIMVGVLPAVFDRLHRKYPGISILVTPISPSAQQYRDLRERKIDLFLGRMSPPIEEDIHAESLFRDRIVVVQHDDILGVAALRGDGEIVAARDRRRPSTKPRRPGGSRASRRSWVRSSRR
jgi:pSer/pThr/pTyr-binding forkhead associated (FHA) protein